MNAISSKCPVGNAVVCAYGGGLLAALDGASVALASGLACSQRTRCGDRKKGKSEQGSSGELHDESWMCWTQGSRMNCSTLRVSSVFDLSLYLLFASNICRRV